MADPGNGGPEPCNAGDNEFLVASITVLSLTMFNI